MFKYILFKIWQLFGVIVGWLAFGLGALLFSAFFIILNFVPFISSASKQKCIRWCIHIGCLTFIIIVRFLGLLKYESDISRALHSKTGHIVIANHPTLIDAVLIFAQTKDICCLVKGGLMDNVFTGAIARLAGFIPNNTPQAINLALEKLSAGENLLVFPEGTRSPNDLKVSFKRGAANIAVASKAPILPIMIKCVPGALKKGAKWYDLPKKRVMFTLNHAQSLRLEDCIDINRAKTIQYRRLTQYLETFYNSWLNKQ